MSKRLTAEENERKAMVPPKLIKVEKTQPKPVVRKSGHKKTPKPKEVKTKPKKRVAAKQTKKPISANNVISDCADVSPSKTNSLLLLSNIALHHFSSDSIENGIMEDCSLNFPQSSSLSVSKKAKTSSYQSQNAKKFSRKLLLLAAKSTRLPPQSELLKIKTSSAVTKGSLYLNNDMTAVEVLDEVRAVLNTLGKKRIRLAAADSSGELEFFKSTKWTAKTLRQRIRYNSVLVEVTIATGAVPKSIRRNGFRPPEKKVEFYYATFMTRRDFNSVLSFHSRRSFLPNSYFSFMYAVASFKRHC
ncbi:hypothetical protein OS493_025690 [Desmophyllum pertusum]|uniref:Uncharacterized protein n=1 Tax=Desmophyllum pertusum TaxID=174260 RepID=A0A9X0D300_9CNID|nr:hypothetical protein OS493_025690 [Desmophyllum pertusum]